jgi:hypothetical protein
MILIVNMTMGKTETGWLMLENAGYFSEWPMFSGQGFVLETYEGYID